MFVLMMLMRMTLKEVCTDYVDDVDDVDGVFRSPGCLGLMKTESFQCREADSSLSPEQLALSRLLLGDRERSLREAAQTLRQCRTQSPYFGQGRAGGLPNAMW